jgi:dTDP-glucose 4,6-dehydratase
LLSDQLESLQSTVDIVAVVKLFGGLMPKIIVIGSNSFSGQDFIDLMLDDEQQEIIGVSRSPEKVDLFLRYRARTDISRFRFHRFDLNLDMPAFLKFLDAEEPDQIVNFAAQGEVGPSWDDPEHWFQTNCVALAQMVKHLSERSYLKRYLHISSPEVYGSCGGDVTESAPLNPSTPYAASKAAADMLLQTFAVHKGFPLMTVRATNVFGARQQLFKIMMRATIYIRLGRKVLLHGGGRAIKSYIHVRDVSRGERAILKEGEVGKTYHLSPDRGIHVCELVAMIAGRLGKSFSEAAEEVDDRLGQDAVYKIVSNFARETLGWCPEISLEQGVDEVVEWIDHHWKTIETLPHEYIHNA